MTRLLAVAGRVDGRLYGGGIRSVAVDLVVSCGDVPFGYLDFVVSMLNRPLVYVPGDEDPDLSVDPTPALAVAPFPLPGMAQPPAEPPGPAGGFNLDGRLGRVAGLEIAGLGGGVRDDGRAANCYTAPQMRARGRRLRRRAAYRRLFRRRPLDVLITHEAGAVAELVGRLAPRVLLHAGERDQRRVGRTLVVGVVPSQTIELYPDGSDRVLGGGT